MKEKQVTAQPTGTVRPTDFTRRTLFGNALLLAGAFLAGSRKPESDKNPREIEGPKPVPIEPKEVPSPEVLGYLNDLKDALFYGGNTDMSDGARLATSRNCISNLYKMGSKAGLRAASQIAAAALLKGTYYALELNKSATNVANTALVSANEYLSLLEKMEK